MKILRKTFGFLALLILLPVAIFKLWAVVKMFKKKK